MAGERPIRPKISFALGHDDRTLSLPWRGPNTPHSGHQAQQHHLLHQPLHSINQSVEDSDEGIEEGSEGEHNAKGKGSSGSDLEVVWVTPGTGLSLEEEDDFDEVAKVLTSDAGLFGKKLTSSTQI
ncbi:hypothetical protein M9H77_31169 [Catharanthus roseus]|uniref:Uncharacterized protein n=1 Tax=Catharanthus roseus TaxID=4058 RepID=A0ACB9ZZC2_CATRO|nr:hypothetical protein M9H77_31169 [Catharanthus roseus]